MPEFLCRTSKPKESSWQKVLAANADEAANIFWFEAHENLPRLSWRGDVGPYVHFALVEVQGHQSVVARVFETGIFRKGRASTMSLAYLANQLGWAYPPEQLLEEGWEGEESWEAAETRKRGGK